MIEDDPTCLEMVGYGFRKDGFEFQGFTRGSEASPTCAATRWTFCCLDFLLPDEKRSGDLPLPSADSRLARFHCFRQPPGEESTDPGARAGRDDYVVKPLARASCWPASKPFCGARPGKEEPGEVIEAASCGWTARTQDVIVRGQPAVAQRPGIRLLFFRPAFRAESSPRSGCWTRSGAAPATSHRGPSTCMSPPAREDRGPDPTLPSISERFAAPVTASWASPTNLQ